MFYSNDSKKNKLFYRRLLSRRRKNNRSFTLVELLIVFSILAVLAAVLTILIKPAQIFAKVRDGQRVQNIKNLNTAVEIFNSTNPTAFIGTSSIVYISLPDAAGNCGNWLDRLPPLPNSGWSYRCATTQNYKKVDGTGWLPINFTADPMINLSQLPTDPVNNTTYFYSYTTDPQWHLATPLELAANRSDKALAGTDGGSSANAYEQGTNLTLIPFNVLNWVESASDPTLIGWWPLTEGGGLTIYDLSTYKHPGSFQTNSSLCGSACMPTWSNQNNGHYAIKMNTQAYVSIISSAGIHGSNSSPNFTISAWIKTAQPNFIGLWANTAVDTAAIFYPQDNYGCWSSSKAVFKYPNATYPLNNSLADNSWHLWTATYDGNQEIDYVDGQIVVNAGRTPNPSQFNLNKITLHTDNGTCNDLSTRGYIGEVRIYSRALSNQAVQDLYAKGKNNYL